jgi:hypothetical protein
MLLECRLWNRILFVWWQADSTVHLLNAFKKRHATHKFKKMLILSKITTLIPNLHKSLLKTDIHWDLQTTSCKFYTWLIEGLILNFQRNYGETKKANQIRQTNWHLAPLWFMKLLRNTYPAWHPTLRPCCTQFVYW